MAPCTTLQVTVIWRGIMAEYRVWYASRDPYHCVFRMVRLLAAKGQPVPVEQLRILDMFLMFPPLLHRLTLTAELREQLRKLNVVSPEKSFVRLPGTASVWQDLQIYQLTALKRLAGLGVLKRGELADRNASLDMSQLPEKLLSHVKLQNASDAPLVSFLVDKLGTLPMTGNEGLVRRAGLPSRGPIT
jgi:hypothetical protein